jgi:hypothetical protein
MRPCFWDSSIRFDLLMSEFISEMTMTTRLTEKLQRAAGVVGRQSAKIEARADALIAREEDIERRTDASFSPHEAILDAAESGLDGLDAKLKLMSNDPLASSGGSPAVEQGATFQPGE